jgi:hypothetical protein
MKGREQIERTIKGLKPCYLLVGIGKEVGGYYRRNELDERGGGSGSNIRDEDNEKSG